MDQTRKRRLNSRKTGSSQCKVARVEESEDFTCLASKDVTDIKGSCRRLTKIRASSPHYDTGQEQHASCSQTPEEDAEKSLIITCDKEHGGARQVGRRKGLRRKRDAAGDGDAQLEAREDEVQPEVEIDQDLDRELESKSRQHNLTSANVRSIIHEVITNEHVVAMMKAAINEMEPVPVFEPKMTRSKLKEVVEKGVVIPAWNISPIKKPTEMKKGPQFVDIPLEEEDSSDEEYQPDEEEEDETAEETLLESDLESSVSSPRGTRVKLHRSLSEHEDDRSSSFRRSLHRSRHLTVAVTPMGPPPPPPVPECSFLEKLHAVDEELAIGPDCMDSYQSLSSTNGDESLISFRTRSKRPLRNVPLGRLEAELRAPDITPDMYEFGSAPEDREWTQWLQGLMISDVENEEEGDDEDDPEYNFLADIDEPDVEDYRNDKAVRITKKEVNDLLEELFDAFQDELGGQDEEGHEEEEEKEEDEIPTQETPTCLENIQCEDPFADVLKQRYRTVREQLAALRKRKALLESKGVSVPPLCPERTSSPLTPMILPAAQKLQLQQQIQQHVQLLTQVNMLSYSVKGLETEASTSKQFLLELQMFAEHGEQARVPLEPGFTSIFRVCNLQGALSLLEELMQSGGGDPSQRFCGSQFPAHLAWLMATRSVFLYPELLPVVQLRPSRLKRPFTSAEDCLVVLGHKHMRSTLHPLQMVCRYLLAARSFICVKSHIREACQKPFDNVIKTYFLAGKCPPMPLACKRVSSCDQRPPVEREQSLMPDWLLKNLKLIYEHVRTHKQTTSDPQSLSCSSAESLTATEEANECLSASPGPQGSFPPGTCYPPYLPEDLSETLKPNLKCKKKNPVKFIKSSKTALTAEELEEALSHLPAILPKATTLLSCTPHINMAVQTATQRPEMNEMSGAPKVVQVGATQGKVIITLPAAVMTSPMSSHPLGLMSMNEARPAVASNVATAGPNQGGLIITLPSSSVCSPLICSAPIIKTPSASGPMNKGHVSQHCGTLLKLIPKDTGRLTSKSRLGYQKTHNQVLLLPPGYVFVGSSRIAKPGHTSKRVLLPKGAVEKPNTMKETAGAPQNTVGGPQKGPPEMFSIQETLIDCIQETAEDEPDNDGGEMVENEVEVSEEGDLTDLFLTLSESSGSPRPSIEDNDMEMVSDREGMGQGKLKGQNAKVEKGTCGQTPGEEPDGVNNGSEVLLVPELQETTEKFSQLATKTQSEMEGNSRSGQSIHKSLGEIHDQTGVEKPSVLYTDTLDDDPHRDAKDVAFAQAYLQKVYEVLQAAPEKLEEFLRVLSEFEKDPESHTSLELLRRLKPVLIHWPELLRDFAAFLHPDEAQECGLLAEQQAFERSRRFLRQLERTFGEQSDLYRKVVCILQAGPSDLVDFKEMKAQIKLLFHDHMDLLEEFWVFLRQLHPQLPFDEDDAADSVSSVETVQGLDGSQPANQLPVRTLSTDKITAIKCRKKRNKQVQLKNKVNEDISVDINQRTTTETSVCAENISHTPTGKKVVLWTREADRVILTTCQRKGAKMATFRAVADQLGNKTAAEVSERFQDLIKLFHRSCKLHHSPIGQEELSQYNKS